MRCLRFGFIKEKGWACHAGPSGIIAKNGEWDKNVRGFPIWKFERIVCGVS